MNVEETNTAIKPNSDLNPLLKASEENKNFFQNPIYVYFEHQNKKISELIIPDPKLNLEELIKQKANSYDIEKNTFMELINKHKIDLLDRNNNDNNNNNNTNNYGNKVKNGFGNRGEFEHETDMNNKVNANVNRKIIEAKGAYVKANNEGNQSSNDKNKNSVIVNKFCSTANNLNVNDKFEYKFNYNGMNGYNYTKNAFIENNNIDNFIQPKKTTSIDDNLPSERHLYEISNRSQNSSAKKSNNYASNKLNSNSNHYHIYQLNNSKSKPNIKNDWGLNKNSKKMNIIKNLKKAEKKVYEEEQEVQEYSNANNYKYKNNNTNHTSNQCIQNNKILQDMNKDPFLANKNENFISHQEISQQKIRENHFSDKSRDISSKSTNINDAIKTNLKNPKDSGLSLFNNQTENKINKIFNIKYNNNNKVSKYKDKLPNKIKLEFLTEREKENFSMLYSLNSNSEKFVIEPAKTAGKFSSSTNNNYSSSAADSKNLISISARNSKANLNTNNSYKKLKDSRKSNLVPNDFNNKNKKLNFQKIKGISAAVNKDSPEEALKNKVNNNKIYIPKSNSNANILSLRSNFNVGSNNNQIYELDSLYNTDCEILKSAKRRDLHSNKFSSINSISNLYSTRKTFLTQRKNKSSDPYSTTRTRKDPNLTYKPKLNKNSIFMNLRKKYSKLLEQEQEKSTNSNKQQFNYNTDENSNSNFYYRDTEDGIGRTGLRHSLLANKVQNKQNRKNKFEINYVSKPEASEVSQVKSRGRSVDEINCITNRLYNYAARYNFSKKMREEDYYNNTCPFTPYLINDVYKLNNIKPSMRNFFYRLQNWVDRRNLKYETDYENTLYDDKTGEKLFSPRINKSNRYSSRRNDFSLNEATKDRFSELYSIWKQKKENFTNIANTNEQEIKFMSNIAHINEKSKEIIENINSKIFLDLFQILSDSEGLIDGRKVDQIDLNEIPPKIKNILLPILEELKEQNETLCADEFLIASQQIYQTLPYDYKQFLMEWYLTNSKFRKHNVFRELADLSFKPKINQKSKVIAKSKLFTSEIYLRAIENLKTFNNENLYVGSNTEN